MVMMRFLANMTLADDKSVIAFFPDSVWELP